MLQKLQKTIKDTRSPTLPGSYHQPASTNWNPLNRNNSSHHDGSARSIHTAPSLQEAWARATKATKATWISFGTCLMMIWLGWRWIRYSSAGIHLTCHSVNCELSLTPLGWGKRVTVLDISRHQLQTAFAIKVESDGTFVTDQGITLTDTYSGGKKSKYKKKQQSSYKGPDENGHYLSYAIVMLDKFEVDIPHETAPGLEQPTEAADLKDVRKFFDVAHKDGKRQYRLIPRQFGIRQSKRRVRTMVNKIESYVKRRRQKLVIRENAPPSWQGVLLIIFGFIGVIIALLLGQFRDPVVHKGPGVRRRHQHNTTSSSNNQQHHHRPTVRDTMQSATPSQYEVSTASTGYRRHTTTARKRAG